VENSKNGCLGDDAVGMGGQGRICLTFSKFNTGFAKLF
jgi:hypothetical protein